MAGEPSCCFPVPRPSLLLPVFPYLRTSPSSLLGWVADVVGFVADELRRTIEEDLVAGARFLRLGDLVEADAHP